MVKDLYIILKGMSMGIAETIPGVSAGTLAFITGIYQRLLNAIQSFGPHIVTSYREGGLPAVWKHIDGFFLLKLLLGMLFGLGIGIFGLSYLLEKYPPIIWAFFLGLVLASILYVVQKISYWNINRLLILFISTIIAYGITQLSMGSVNDNGIFVFFCGMIAISAMILPGISGSFILLIMGMYQFILHDNLKEGVLEQQDPQAMMIILIFGLGCIVGLLTFSRVLTWTFKKYYNNTMAALTGFLLGSAYKLWPWRVPVLGYNESDELIRFPTHEIFDKVIKESFVTPSSYYDMLATNAYFIPSIISLILGFSIVFYLSKNEIMES